MANRDRLIEQLRQVPLFSACSRGDLKIVARHAVEVEVPAKTTVVKEGDKGDCFYVVVAGEATVRRKAGRVNKKVATLGPGGWFGELALLDPAPRNATVVASQDSTLAALDVRVFRALLRDVPALSEKLLAGLAGRLRAADLSLG
jgi:CRP/FNR family transcriptional regulator, cyclic AMP receptor protein